MNLKLLAAAAAVSVCAFAAAPALAGDGFVDAGYVNLNAAGTSADAYTADLAYNAVLTPTGWGLQGNLSYLDANNLPKEFVSGQVTGFKRAKNYLYGAYISYADNLGIDSWEGGVLGQYYGDKYTVSGSVGYGQLDFHPNIDQWNLNAKASYYFTNNFSIGATAGYEQLSSSGSDIDLTTLGAQAEWKPKTLPVSFIASYQNEKLSHVDGTIGVTTLGVRWNFGGSKTVKQRDQSGVISATTQHLLF